MDFYTPCTVLCLYMLTDLVTKQACQLTGSVPLSSPLFLLFPLSLCPVQSPPSPILSFPSVPPHLTHTEVLDFTASSGEIVIQPNTTQYDLKVEIIDDAIREDTEEFEVGISTSGTGSAVTVITMGIKTARIAIIDDDSECMVSHLTWN